jgi:hypothetical protein
MLPQMKISKRKITRNYRLETVRPMDYDAIIEFRKKKQIVW